MHTSFNSLRRAGRSLSLVSVGVLSTLGALSLSHVGPAQAQSPGVNLAALVAQVKALTAQNTALQTRVTALETNTAALHQNGPPGSPGGLLQISGVNVQIVNGNGSTDAMNGLGNLIVGYNQAGNANAKDRSGSHNLILGDQNVYTSYGGIVAGYQNTVSGAFACVTGGQDNSARNGHASVSGGYGNTASGGSASISGGQSLTQSNDYGWSGGSYATP